MLTEKCDLVIVGLGPAGLEAALQAQILGMPYIAYERDVPGSLIERTMHDKKFLHDYGRNIGVKVKGALNFPDRLLGHELVHLWHEQAKQLAIEKVAVDGIIANVDDFKVITKNGERFAKYIILASGTMEHPKMLGISGEEGNPRVLRTLDYAAPPEGEKIIVVGGGNSALETALELAPYNAVTLLVRKPHLAHNTTERNANDLHGARERGELVVLFETTLTGIEEASAQLLGPQGEVSLHYDLIYIHAGFLSPCAWLESIGLFVGAHGLPILNENLESSVSGIFVAGALTGADSVVESANQAYDIVHHIQHIHGTSSS